jgi:DNA-binding PucR family transcriptional regulator
MHEIRGTLRCYLDYERSTAKVAAEQHISRNTVTYRVQQAMRPCGYRRTPRRCDFMRGLSMVDWLS